MSDQLTPAEYVEIQDVAGRLDDLVAAVHQGETVIFTRNGQPVACLKRRPLTRYVDFEGVAPVTQPLGTGVLQTLRQIEEHTDLMLDDWDVNSRADSPENDPAAWQRLALRMEAVATLATEAASQARLRAASTRPRN